ncbi:MAG: phage baseplate plug family protein [Fusobacteriaceae bacterium]
MEILDVKNTDIPCDLKIKIKEKTFILSLKFRGFDNRIICDLADEFGKEIANCEKMVFGVPLFYYLYKDRSNNFNQEFPGAYIIPTSTDGIEVPVTLENFSTKVFLAVVDV